MVKQKKITVIETSLLDKRVQITLELPKDTDWEARRDENSRYAGWRHIGKIGYIRAVWLDEESKPVCLIELPTDKLLVEIWATHLALGD